MGHGHSPTRLTHRAYVLTKSNVHEHHEETEHSHVRQSCSQRNKPLRRVIAANVFRMSSSNSYCSGILRKLCQVCTRPGSEVHKLTRAAR